MDYGLLAINYGLETRTKLFQAEHFRLKSSCDLQKKLKSKEFVRKENKLDFVTGIAKKHTFLPHYKDKKVLMIVQKTSQSLTSASPLKWPKY